MNNHGIIIFNKKFSWILFFTRLPLLIPFSDLPTSTAYHLWQYSILSSWVLSSYTNKLVYLKPFECFACVCLQRLAAEMPQFPVSLILPDLLDTLYVTFSRSSDFSPVTFSVIPREFLPHEFLSPNSYLASSGSRLFTVKMSYDSYY